MNIKNTKDTAIEKPDSSSVVVKKYAIRILSILIILEIIIIAFANHQTNKNTKDVNNLYMKLKDIQQKPKKRIIGEIMEASAYSIPKNVPNNQLDENSAQKTQNKSSKAKDNAPNSKYLHINKKLVIFTEELTKNKIYIESAYIRNGVFDIVFVSSNKEGLKKLKKRMENTFKNNDIRILSASDGHILRSISSDYKETRRENIKKDISYRNIPYTIEYANMEEEIIELPEYDILQDIAFDLFDNIYKQQAYEHKAPRTTWHSKNIPLQE